ncbi:hypothetical protein [Promicromonospora sp. MEB111]|uniref:hypothetical protein n=1 Tax=Promicromonospora sp. MEB111 TaxID=3040301 RepID=UPI00254A2123|nr:hypothetical protein [Promicromonospora sp. MEB111]
MVRNRRTRLGWPASAIVVLLSLALLSALGVVLFLRLMPGSGLMDPSGGVNVQYYEHQVDTFEHELEERAGQGRLDRSEIDAIFGDTLSVEWGGEFGEGYRIVAHVEAPGGYEPCHTYELSPFGGASPDSLEIPEACRDQ